MLRNIKIIIEYDGTNFNGWQVQTCLNGNEKIACGDNLPKFAAPESLRDKKRPGRFPRTVQGEIEKVLKIIYKKDIKLIGSGRTDSGVHAVGQTANFKIRSPMPCNEIQGALNANLPEDIAVLDVTEVPLNFHARYSVKSKIYRYTILNRHARCAQQRNFCLLYPRRLNVRSMREAAKFFVGRKDFKSFAASDPAKRKSAKKENTVRSIKRLTITKKGDFLYVDIEADGFLYKMVRNIVGTLLAVGSGQLPVGDIPRVLLQKDRCAAGNTAKAKGLTLLEVRY